LALALALLGVLALLAYLVWPSRDRPLTAQDLVSLDQDYRRNAQDTHVAVNALFGYAAVINQYGDIQAMVSGRQGMLDENPVFADRPDVRKAVVKADDAWQRYREKLGITSDQEWERLLERGMELGREVTARPELDRSQRAAVHLAAAKIFFHADRLDEAMEEVTRAEAVDRDSVAVTLQKADILEKRHQWSAAIKELRKASFQLGAWANRPPQWDVRLMWVLSGRRGHFRERRWRERQRQVAGNLQHVIRSQIMVLQGLERLQKIPAAGTGSNRPG
jgi:tetratricopeptide (TPR) repeat protein